MAQVAKAIQQFIDGVKASKAPTGNKSALSAGVSLRDFFAAQAMNAIIIGNEADICVTGKEGARGMAKDAYNVADAMLEIRQAN